MQQRLLKSLVALKNPLDLFGNDYHTGFLISYTEKIIANQTLSTLCLTFIVLFYFILFLLHLYQNMEANLFYLNLSSLILIRLHPWINANFCWLRYSIPLELPKGVQFYFIFLFLVISTQFRSILSRAGNFHTSVPTEKKNTLTTPWKKILDSYCYGLFRSFEAILLNTGQNSRSNRYANTIAVNVLCFTVFLFLIFTCFLQLLLHPLSPHPINALLYLYWSKQMVFIYLIHLFSTIIHPC